MVFNWFRRRFDEKPKTPQGEEVDATAEPEQVAQPQAEGQSQDAAADYLSWAKSAYQNIQKQQAQPAGTTSAVPEQTEPSTTEEEHRAIEAVEAEKPSELKAVEPIDLVVETAVDQTKAVPETEDSASLAEATAVAETSEFPELTSTEVTPVEPEEAFVPEFVAQDMNVSPEQAALEVEIPTPQAAAATPPEPVVPSFLARAGAERQARLERLKATAIEEPEPEISQPVTAKPELETPEQIPGLAFDEGFLWSAELLAAQGRHPDQISLEEITWLKRLRQGLDKTRRSLVNQLKAIVGQGPLNQDAVTEIETLLLQADVGVEATDAIIEALQSKLRSEVLPPDAAIAYLKKILRDMLDNPLGQAYSPTFAPEKNSLNVWLLTGVNGAGKTTTIGKIAHIAQESGYRCLIAAADTFRAAAVEQVKIWGQRSGVEVIANPGKNTDPAAVVFDAIAAAQGRDIELLLVDTAGRLQNKKNLMDELSKIRRIVDKKAPDAIVESLLVLDATLGQNGLRQAEVFSQAAQLTGVVLTKLDGTAKGGVALAIVQQLGLPIRFIGAGEGIQDLRPFSSYEFVEALLSG